MPKCEKCGSGKGKERVVHDPDTGRKRKFVICVNCLIAWGKEWGAKMAASLARP